MWSRDRQYPVERVQFAFLGQTAAGRRTTAEAEQEQLSGSGRSGMLALKTTAPLTSPAPWGDVAWLAASGVTVFQVNLGWPVPPSWVFFRHLSWMSWRTWHRFYGPRSAGDPRTWTELARRAFSLLPPQPNVLKHWKESRTAANVHSDTVLYATRGSRGGSKLRHPLHSEYVPDDFKNSTNFHPVHHLLIS